MLERLKSRKALWALTAVIVTLIVLSAGLAYVLLKKDEQEVPTLKVGYLPITHALLPLVATDRGQFTELRVEMVKFSSWPELAEALQSGAIDAGGSILNTLAMKLVEKGVPLRSVLMAVRDGSVLVVDLSIYTPEDLIGKTIAIPSKFSPHYILLVNYLEDHNISIEQVTTVEMAPPDMVSALAAGSIDAYIVAEPFGAKAELMGIGRVLVLSKDIEIANSTSNECVIAIRTEFIEAHPDAVQDFVLQLILAGQFVTENPNEAATMAIKYIGQNETCILTALIEPPGRSGYLDLYPRESEYAAFQAEMLRLGLIQTPIDIEEFVDESFAAEAYRSLGVEYP